MSLPTVSRTALRASMRASSRSVAAPAARSLSVLSQAAPRPSVKVQSKAAAAPLAVQSRGMKTLDFAGSKEVVYERSDWPLEKLHDYFKNDTFALVSLLICGIRFSSVCSCLQFAFCSSATVARATVRVSRVLVWAALESLCSDRKCLQA